MRQANNQKKFKPRARLLVQLGNQLIRNENIAVVEIVKNAYDADATKCEVVFDNINSKDLGEIIIKDNGIGMTPQIINEVWLEPGADFKELLLKGNQSKLNFDFTLPLRTPIGEKGVGRFGVHKLGDLIQLITKSPDSPNEVVVEIDWQVFEKQKYLEDATFEVLERAPELFINGQTGTSISIKKLRKPWDKKLYRDLQKTILSLSSPFNQNNDFHVQSSLNLEDKSTQEDWDEKILRLDEIRQKALWTLDCTIEGDKITDFQFEFKPWPEMDKLDRRVLTTQDLPDNKIKYKDGIQEVEVDLSKHKIGPIRVQAYLFDLGARILKLGFQDPAALKSYMASNGGVRVYRDGMRVYDYGEVEDDWLSLDKTRINEPVQKIGNRNIIAAVSLDRKKSQDLVEKTNREGFVETDAYFDFQHAVGAIIDIFAQQRNIDKTHIRQLYEGASKTQPVLHDIDELKSNIEDKLKNVDIGDKAAFTKEVFSSLDRIKDQYIETNNILLKSAGAGLSLSVVIHEVEKRLKELIKLVNSESFDTKRIRSVVGSISKLVDNYSALVSEDKTKNVSIKKIIDDSIFNTEFRFKAHDVTVIKKYEDIKDSKVDCALNAILGVLLNIFDNSLYWLSAYGVSQKKILIDVKSYGQDEVSIIIADNGKGFTIAPEDAVQPFITTRPGGIGLGLHIVNEMMKAHGGKLIIRDYHETTGIPEEFKNGAIVELVFKAKK